MKNEAVIAAVVALLKGIEVDGETMEYIIKQVDMEEQMKKQLSPVMVPDHVLVQISADIACAVADEGYDIIDDYELEMRYKEVNLEDVTFNKIRLENIVLNELHNYFDNVE